MEKLRQTNGSWTCFFWGCIDARKNLKELFEPNNAIPRDCCQRCGKKMDGQKR